MLEVIIVGMPTGYSKKRFINQMPHTVRGHRMAAGTPNEVDGALAWYFEADAPLDPTEVDLLQAECETLTAAYDPALLTPGEQARQEQVESRSRWAALSALRGKSVAEIYDIVQNRIDGWTSLAEAKADFREWMPLLVAAVAWDIMKDANAEE
jgi:hypothetical protein